MRTSDLNIQCKVTTLLYPTDPRIIIYSLYTAEIWTRSIPCFSEKALVGVNTGHTVRSGYKNKSVHTNTMGFTNFCSFHDKKEEVKIRKSLVSSCCPKENNVDIFHIQCQIYNYSLMLLLDRNWNCCNVYTFWPHSFQSEDIKYVRPMKCQKPNTFMAKLRKLEQKGFRSLSGKSFLRDLI